LKKEGCFETFPGISNCGQCDATGYTETTQTVPFKDLIFDGWEIHYASVAGEIALHRKGSWVRAETWPEKHELLGLKIELGRGDHLRLVRTINYGSPLFSGHTGHVDVYVMKG